MPSTNTSSNAYPSRSEISPLDPLLIIIRSFDVNKSGAEVEIRPGIVTKVNARRNKCKSIFSKIVSLHAESNHLSFTVPGGLIGAGTKLDTTLCRADRLVGQVLGAVGKPLKVRLALLRRPIANPPTPTPGTGNQPLLTPPTPRRPDGR